jgi:beta-glucosidase
MELKGFQKIRLAPGAARTVEFTLTAEDLAFYSARERWEAEPGEFAVFVGTSSVDVIKEQFVLKAPAEN